MEEIIDNNSVSTENLAYIKRILRNFQHFESLQKELESYKIAARWLKFRKADWTKEASRIAIKAYPKLFPINSKKQFQQDIAGCLEWVYTSLYVYGQPCGSLEKFVSKPQIKSSIPYIAAIRHIKNNKDRGELTMDESLYLEDMLDELIKEIRNFYEPHHSR